MSGPQQRAAGNPCIELLVEKLEGHFLGADSAVENHAQWRNSSIMPSSENRHPTVQSREVTRSVNTPIR
jgi:hypothetical protein